MIKNTLKMRSHNNNSTTEDVVDVGSVKTEVVMKTVVTEDTITTMTKDTEEAEAVVREEDAIINKKVGNKGFQSRLHRVVLVSSTRRSRRKIALDLDSLEDSMLQTMTG